MAAPAELARLAREASDDARELAATVLRQDVSDQAWRRQLGPALTAEGTARLLGISRQAVAKRKDLVALRNRSGRVVYPVMQFDGRGPVAGLGKVVAVLRSVVEPLMVASWLTGQNSGLGGQRPVDALATGELDEVVKAAERFAAGMSG